MARKLRCWRQEMRSWAIRLGFFLIILNLAGSGWGDVPRTINYQGKLTTKDYHPVPDGNYSITLNLYRNINDTLAIWSQVANVGTKNGYFNVILGSNPNMPLNLDFDAPYYLGVQLGSEPEMSPRMELNSVPYALNVANGSITTAKIQDSQITTNKIADNAVTQAKANFAPSVWFNGTARSNPKIVAGYGQTGNDGKATINLPLNCFTVSPVVTANIVEVGVVQILIVVTAATPNYFSVASCWSDSATPVGRYFYYIAVGY
jgi:hypothetical protein